MAKMAECTEKMEVGCSEEMETEYFQAVSFDDSLNRSSDILQGTVPVPTFNVSNSTELQGSQGFQVLGLPSNQFLSLNFSNSEDYNVLAGHQAYSQLNQNLLTHNNKDILEPVAGHSQGVSISVPTPSVACSLNPNLINLGLTQANASMLNCGNIFLGNLNVLGNIHGNALIFQSAFNAPVTMVNAADAVQLAVLTNCDTQAFPVNDSSHFSNLESVKHFNNDDVKPLSVGDQADTENKQHGIGDNAETIEIVNKQLGLQDQVETGNMDDKSVKCKASPKQRGRKKSRSTSASGSDAIIKSESQAGPSPVKMEVVDLQTGAEMGFKLSLLDEILTEKKMALMRSPEVMQFLKVQQRKIAREKEMSSLPDL